MKKIDCGKKYLSAAYDILFCILSLIAVYLAMYDMLKGCSEFQQSIDTAITIIFIFDYVFRLFLSKNKRDFFKTNLFDLLAIIPFNSLFKIFRLLKFFRVFKFLKIFKLLKFSRVTVYFLRFYKHIKFFFEINGLKYMVFISLFCIVAGGITIHFIEGMSLFDGIWWSFVTTTTVGYGDISPVSPAGRIVAAILMIVGIGLIGSLTSTLTALFFQNHEKATKVSAKSQIIKALQEQLNNFDNLSPEDIETICQTIKSLYESNK